MSIVAAIVQMGKAKVNVYLTFLSKDSIEKTDCQEGGNFFFQHSRLLVQLLPYAACKSSIRRIVGAAIDMKEGSMV